MIHKRQLFLFICVAGLLLSLRFPLFSQDITPSQGIEFYSRGQYRQALNCWNALLQRRAHDSLYAWRARTLLDMHLLTEAQKDATEALRLAPENAAYHALLGDIQLAAGLWQEASHSYEKALILTPYSEEWSAKRAYALYMSGEKERALQQLQELQNTANLSLWLSRIHARIALQEKNYMRAIELYSSCIKQSQNIFFFDLTERGVAYLALGQYHKALEDFRLAAALRPSSPLAFYQQALCYYRMGSYHTAMQQIEYCLQQAPSFTEGLLLRATIAQKLQESKSVEACYRQLLKDAPHHLSAYVGLAQYYLSNNRIEQADSLIQACLALNRDHLPALALQYVLYKKQQEDAKAQMLLSYYLQLCRSGSDYYYLAKACFDFLPQERWNPEGLQWAKKAANQQDTYAHNLLWAQMLYKAGHPLRAYSVCVKAIALAQKEHLPAEEALQLKHTLDSLGLDDTPPVIELVSPQADERGHLLVTSATFTIAGRITDESSIRQLHINGIPLALSKGGEFLYTHSLHQPHDTLYIEACDIHGNCDSKRFILDASPLLSRQAPTHQKRRYYALLFATNQYEHWNDLVNPVPDAQAIAHTLRTLYGFEIDLVINPSKEQVLLKIKEYLLKEYQAEDELFIFFAGHGQYDELFGEGYLVTADSRTDDETKSSYLSYSSLRTYINNIPCRHILLMMDVCFGGTFDPAIAKTVQQRGISELNAEEREAFIKEKLSVMTRKYITSGGKEYVSDGTPGKHSPFVRRFLEALRSMGGDDRILTIAELMTYLEVIKPQPRLGEFGDNEPGSDFLFIMPLHNHK
ncbi:tetratricopeptide (TPR) repeat protein [Thermonema lapsum]|uniref:Tetratricopeptide (TPR) repeat protein n=1 Tax=Thermonema lapsum TaxID=28195 RepID=A0A846MM85_9BACT|nr:caspase family protein [Thermonema lapsum]NIK72653.1 tetratricopeptide (TPR) repeat protein [Thermonema lapsum]